MSTITLEKLPESVAVLAALIRDGKRVRLTAEGKTVATVVPPAKRTASRRKPKTAASVAEVLAACRPVRAARTDRDFTAFLRAERDKE